MEIASAKRLQSPFLPSTIGREKRLHGVDDNPLHDVRD
jgi:hypothetical protein